MAETEPKVSRSYLGRYYYADVEADGGSLMLVIMAREDQKSAL